MTITQMAHFMAVKDMAIQLKIQSMARTYQSTIKPFMNQDDMMEVENKMDPVVDPHNQRIKAELKKGVEEFVPKDGKFTIKDTDLNQELLSLNGELKIAQLEIKRLRTQLHQI